jgi:serine protease Do
MPHKPRVRPIGTAWLPGVLCTLASLMVVQASPLALGSTLRRTAVVRAVEQAKSSVVNIHGRKAVRGDQRQLTSVDGGRQVNGMGTGIIIDERGYILTNFHVVDGVTQIKVTMADQRTLTAILIAHDPTTDLAVIKIKSESPLPVIRIGTSADLMEGEEVIAVGNAYGYTHTVTRGIISALHRSVQVSDDQHYHDLIQTDASINPGNSGGPLLNIDGEMIGINVAVRVGAQGIGFALPIDQAMEVAARLIGQHSPFSHGVTGKTHTDSHGSLFEITGVSSGSAAAQAGLEPGDIVLSVGDYKVERTLDWERALLELTAGSNVPVKVERNRETVQLDLAVRTGQNPDAGTQDLAWRILGVRLAPAPSGLFTPTNESRYRGGLQVTAVRGDGPAAQRGVRRGDVLVGLHKWETVSLENVAYILASSEFRATQPIKFFVLRGDETLYGHLRVAFGE